MANLGKEHGKLFFVLLYLIFQHIPFFGKFVHLKVMVLILFSFGSFKFFHFFFLMLVMDLQPFYPLLALLDNDLYEILIR